MKKTIFFFLILLTLIGCSKDAAKGDPVFQLPPETQTGANTFGVTIRGKVYVPRDPTGVNYGGARPRGMIWTSGGILPNRYNELDVKDGASTVGFKIILHMQNFEQNGTGQYILKNSNFQNQADSVLENHLYFKIWDSVIGNYAYYGSIENQGVINITRNDVSNFIISGNFTGKFKRFDNPNDIIQITDGRFDIGPGLLDKIFP